MTRRATPDEVRRHEVWCDRQRGAAELADIHRALLRTLPFDLIVQEVDRRGWRVCVAPQCRYDRLPAVYPPLADDDLPFDAEGDG